MNSLVMMSDGTIRAKATRMPTADLLGELRIRAAAVQADCGSDEEEVTRVVCARTTMHVVFELRARADEEAAAGDQKAADDIRRECEAVYDLIEPFLRSVPAHA